MNSLKTVKRYLAALLLVGAALTSVSCDKSFFDGEEDCEVIHILRFRYEMNLKWADAFPSEVSSVNSVNLYVYDSKGLFVKEYRGRGDELSSPDYHIVLDLPAGDYRFVAWCGLETGAAEESFTVPQPVAGVSRIEELTCSLTTQSASVYARADAPRYSNKCLTFLYHGYMSVHLEDNHDGQRYEHVMYLTKDTNHIRVVLQELQGEGMDSRDYDITIEDANGIMAYDNALLACDKITYEPWLQDSDEIGVGKPESNEGIEYIRGIYADLTVGRLLASRQDKLMLTIKKHDTKEEIACVPFLQYALLANTRYYEDVYGHKMDDQEFLDREDEYVLTFFLRNGKWTDGMIMIHSWRIVRHEYAVGGN